MKPSIHDRRRLVDAAADRQENALDDAKELAARKMADELDYVPMPAAVVKQIQDEWKKSLRDPQGKPIY